jgi:hypothetical protein
MANKTAERLCTTCGFRNEVDVKDIIDGSFCRGCRGRLRPLSQPLAVDGKSLEAIVKGTRLPVVCEVQLKGSVEEREQKSALEKSAEHLEGKALVVKLDADEERALALRLGINTVPAFVVFINGQIEYTFEGAADAGVIEEWVWQLTH